MMRYIYSPRAQKDLNNIFDYYSEVNSVKVAMRIVNSIQSSIKQLIDFPNLGRIEPLLEEFPQGFRCLVNVPNYKIIYWIDDCVVKIATIFDCRQQPQYLYKIIESRSNWMCEPEVKYK
jgi:Plasmid stabilization system protein